MNKILEIAEIFAYIFLMILVFVWAWKDTHTAELVAIVLGMLIAKELRSIKLAIEARE